MSMYIESDNIDFRYVYETNVYLINSRMPNCTTVVQTANDFLNPKFK